MEILIRNQQSLPVNQARLIRVAKKLLRVEEFPRPAEVSVLLTTDEQIRQLNRDYRGKDRPTDVLSFQQLEDDVPFGVRWLDTALACEPPHNKAVSSHRTPRGRSVEEPVILGDVVISVETAARQAAERGRSLDDELSLLVAHGILHLLGYDDETEEGAEEMRRHEEAGTCVDLRLSSPESDARTDRR